jgi:leucyl aminopeptidase
VVEGIALAGYRYRPPAQGRELLLEQVTLVGREQEAAAGLQVGKVMAEATLRARRWADQPAGELSPRAFAVAVAQAAAAVGLEAEIWDEERIAAERLGCLASVAAGSTEPPRLVRVTYDPPGARARLALVGKGITFDSGGLSLKPAEAMETMKGDMGGAAAVFATVLALPELAPPVRVDAWGAIAENMPSGSATRPGDVVTARDGTTVEVVNTDAEGRLVLADALLVAGEPRPDAIIDIATLTGGQRAALGPEVAAVLGSDDLVGRVLAAAAAAGEPAWRLPLWAGYNSRLRSEVADLRNVAPDRAASTIMAALFLQRFVGELPWAHLDIAAPSYSDSEGGWLSKGNTGWGARTLLQLVSAWAG